MILSAQSIRQRGIFSPFFERSTTHGMTYGLGPAGYDVRIRENFILEPGKSKLASTIEHISMPYDLMGKVADKSTWARQFMAVQNTVIEPGWHGYLTLELSNHGPMDLVLAEGMPIAQIVLHQLDQPTDRPYDGKYQGQQPGAVRPIFGT